MKPLNAPHRKRSRATDGEHRDGWVGKYWGRLRSASPRKCESPAWGNGAFFGGRGLGESSSIGRSGPEKVQDKRAAAGAVTGHQPVCSIEKLSRFCIAYRGHRKNSQSPPAANSPGGLFY